MNIKKCIIYLIVPIFLGCNENRIEDVHLNTWNKLSYSNTLDNRVQKLNLCSKMLGCSEFPKYQKVEFFDEDTVLVFPYDYYNTKSRDTINVNAYINNFSDSICRNLYDFDLLVKITKSSFTTVIKRIEWWMPRDTIIYDKIIYQSLTTSSLTPKVGDTVHYEIFCTATTSDINKRRTPKTIGCIGDTLHMKDTVRLQGTFKILVRDSLFTYDKRVEWFKTQKKSAVNIKLGGC